MVRFGPGLERRQAVLGRIVDIGAELLVMAAVLSRAKHLSRDVAEPAGAVDLADAFCRAARRRNASRFRALFRNDDTTTYRIAQRVVAGDFEWLEKGGVSLDSYRSQLERAAARPGSPARAEPVGEPVSAG
jgi:hypothetical protein